MRKSLYMKILIYYLREIIFIFIFHKGKIKTNKYLIHPYHCNTRKKLARKTDTYANYPFFPKSAHLLQTKVLPVKVSNFKTDINLYNSLRTKHITVSLLSRSSCSTIFYHWINIQNVRNCSEPQKISCYTSLAVGAFFHNWAAYWKKITSLFFSPV